MKYLLLIVLIVIPFVASARSVDRSDLDDDAVDDFAVPVLFGVSIDAVEPDFGDPRGGGTRSHEGQDFLAPKGTPIVSPTEAIVLKKGTGSSAGKYIYTANPGGETFRYMHLDEVADVDVGDTLEVGDYIGTVGDTGNAGPGQYHLHFETRNNRNRPVDPHPRITETFSLEDQMEFLETVFKNRRDDDNYAAFLITTFPEIFKQALLDDIDMPRAIDRAINDAGLDSDIEAIAGLIELIATIPAVLTTDMNIGDSDVRVTLLQIYIIYSHQGVMRDRLAAAGPTGYFGSITAAALRELQQSEDIAQTGNYDSATRSALQSRAVDELVF